MFKRKNRKGFTIVELVIVIAVIGILAAILIPTFVSLNDKANDASDRTLIHNLNTALRIEEAQEGKNKTLNDAVEDLDDYGYKLANLVSKSGENLLWDQELDEFVVNKGEEDYNKSKYWEIRSNMPDPNTNKRSIYAGNNWNEPNVSITNGSGFDAGTNSVSSINYSRTYTGTDDANGHDVVIRTNSIETALTVNGYVNPSDASKGDVIRHYGAAGSVDIISVANASYHEYGKVAFMEIAKGRAALESGSQVTQIHISTQVTAVANDGTKTKTANTFDSITIALANDIEAPEFSRDAVSEIAEGGTLVVALQEGTVDANASKDYVWLYQQGVIQQMVVTTTSTFDANSKATDYAETSNTYQVADDIANNVKAGQTLTAEDFEVDGSIKTTSQEKVQESGLVSERLKTVKEQAVFEAVVEEEKANYEGDYWIDAHANSFAGGKGTEEDPYLVSKPMELALIAYNVNNGIELTTQQIESGYMPYAGAYYKLIASINLDGKAWTALGTWQHPFHGSIDGDDGNGGVYEIKNMKDGGAATMGAIFQAYTTRTVGGPYGFIGIAGSETSNNDSLTIKNIAFTDVDVDLEQGNCVGIVIGYSPRTKEFGGVFNSISEALTSSNQYSDWFANAASNPNKNTYYFDGYYWKNYTYIGSDGRYYSGMANAVGVGNMALKDIIIDNVSVSGSITGLDCVSGIIGKAYNSGLFSATNCEINCTITATGGRAAGIAGYASVPSSVVINDNTIVGKISATNTGVAADYLTGSRDNVATVDENYVASGDSSKFTCSGNTYNIEIWWQGNKQE